MQDDVLDVHSDLVSKFTEMLDMEFEEDISEPITEFLVLDVLATYGLVLAKRSTKYEDWEKNIDLFAEGLRDLGLSDEDVPEEQRKESQWTLENCVDSALFLADYELQQSRTAVAAEELYDSLQKR